MTALGVGAVNPVTEGVCTLVGSAAKQFPVFCADGSEVGSANCSCTEYTGNLTGSFIGGTGTFTLDVVADKSLTPGSFITLPGVAAPASTCFTATGVGLTIGSPSPLPALVVSVTGTVCPAVPVIPDVAPAGLPGGISGSVTILNPQICPALVASGTIPACIRPLATGGGSASIQLLPDGSMRMTWSGAVTLGPTFNQIK